MIFPLASGYALRALIHIATHKDNLPILASVIAAEENIAGPTLAKILGKLSSSGIVDSRSGPNGGFWLTLRPDEITMRMIVDLFETQRNIRECLLGHKQCPGPKYCKLHCHWQKPQKYIDQFLDQITLADISPNTAGLSPDIDNIESLKIISKG